MQLNIYHPYYVMFPKHIVKHQKMLLMLFLMYSQNSEYRRPDRHPKVFTQQSLKSLVAFTT